MHQRILLKVFRRTNGKCFYCGNNGEVIDHFIPKKLWLDWNLTTYMGNVNDPSNLILACYPCNSKKSSKHPYDFIGKRYTDEDAMWNHFNKLCGLNG